MSDLPNSTLHTCSIRMLLMTATTVAAGSWGCFDEFNRLVPEVLSVCSVQYKCVTDAQKRKTMLPGRGLEYIDRSGQNHKVCSQLMSCNASTLRYPCTTHMSTVQISCNICFAASLV